MSKPVMRNSSAASDAAFALYADALTRALDALDTIFDYTPPAKPVQTYIGYMEQMFAPLSPAERKIYDEAFYPGFAAKAAKTTRDPA